MNRTSCSSFSVRCSLVRENSYKSLVYRSEIDTVAEQGPVEFKSRPGSDANVDLHTPHLLSSKFEAEKVEVHVGEVAAAAVRA